MIKNLDIVINKFKNYYRYYDIVGVTHSEPKTEKMYKIVCKGE